MNRRFLIGIILLLLSAGIIAAYQFVPKPDTRPIVAVRGYMGGEKVGFVQDADVQRILRDRYRLTVNAQPLGSIELVTTNSTGQDFLWPSNEVALELYKEQHNSQANATTIFNSPIVFYSWDIVTDALIQQGIVKKVDTTYYIDDMPGFVQLLTDPQKQKRWADIGLPQLYGKVELISTDPTKSNSGNMFYGMMANMLNGGQVADDASLDKSLPVIKKYYDGLGYLEQGSGDLFQRFVRTGVGDKPIIVGYESQLIEFSIANEANRDEILKRIRIIYPRPTVWSSHPLIALTPNGDGLKKALQDADIQRIAWEKHGFRSGLIGIQNDPKVLNIVGIPATITSVLPLPRPKVMDRLIQYLSQ
jgi:hypothetical protein